MPVGTFFTATRAALAKHLHDAGATNWFLLATLAAVTIYPLLFVGYTTNDDLMLAIESGLGDFWGSAWKFSTNQGRIGFLWAHPLFQLPYLFDNRVWYLATKYGSLLLLLGALYYSAFRMFRSSWVAFASLVLFLAFVQNDWDHNALTSYPFVVNFLASLFLISLGLFCEALDRRNLALAGLSAGLYFFALANEFFVLFFPFYVAVLLLRGAPGESLATRFVSGRKYLFAVAISLLIYLTLYAVWRSLHPSIYAGNRPDGVLDLVAAARVVAVYSLSAIPVASLSFLVSPGAQLPLSDSVGFGAMLSESSSISLVKAAVAGLLFARLMSSASFQVPRARTLLIGAALAFCAMFLPNVLLGLTKKYQDWVTASGSRSYLYTYHSFIAAVVLGALLLAYVRVRIRSWRPIPKLLLIGAGVLATMSVSLAVEVKNHYVAFDQKLSHRKWQLVDEVIKSPAFAAIPDGSTVVAPTLAAYQRGIAPLAPNAYWTRYVRFKTGKNVRFVDDECAGEAPCYSLVFRQAQHADNQFIVLSKIGSPRLPEPAELTIYSMPPRRSTLLLGSFTPGSGSPRLAVDDVPVSNVHYGGGIGLFSAYLPYVPDASVQTARVTANVEMIPNAIAISHHGSEPRLRTWSAELAAGIDLSKQGPLVSSIGVSNVESLGYPNLLVAVSGMSGYEPWGRWTDAAAGPVAKFRFRQALPTRFRLELTAGAFGPNAGAPVKVRVGTIEKSVVISAAKEPDTYHLVFETDGTADTLEIVPPKPTSPNEIDPTNRDPRKLGVGLYSIRIHDLTPQN